MIIYNITVKVEAQIADAWLSWMLEKQIPQIMNTKCFISFKVVRLLEVDEAEGPTYAIQYQAESKADYNRYIELFAHNFNEQSYKKWGDRFIAFRSVMQVVK